MDKADVRTITKKDLSERIAAATGEKRACVHKVLQAFLDEIVAELAKGNRIEFRQFGVFEVKTRAPRTAQNPRTLERVRVPERKSVKFKPGREMRDRIEVVETTPIAGAERKPAPLSEPKAGVRPDTRDIGKRVESPARRDGQAVRQG